MKNRNRKIRSLAIASVLGATGVIASASPAHAATYNWSVSACVNSPGEAKVKVRNKADKFTVKVESDVEVGTESWRVIRGTRRRPKTSSGFVAINPEDQYGTEIQVWRSGDTNLRYIYPTGPC